MRGNLALHFTSYLSTAFSKILTHLKTIQNNKKLYNKKPPIKLIQGILDLQK